MSDDDRLPALTPDQVAALQEFQRTVGEVITRMWEAARPAFEFITAAAREAHNQGQHLYRNGWCVYCHARQDQAPAPPNTPPRADGA